MALIKTMAEIRAVIPRLSNVTDKANLPNVHKAGLLHIMPIIGTELYRDLDAKYNSVGPLTDPEVALLKAIQLPLAAFAILDDLSFIHSTITDNGIRTASSANMDAAHRWEYMELRQTLETYAADGIELLLSYLEETQVNWPLWTNSKAFKALSSLYVRTGSDFMLYYPIAQPFRTFWLLKPIITEVEENYLVSELGRPLTKWMKMQDNIMVDEQDIQWLAKSAIANLTIKHAGEKLRIQFSDAGFYFPTNANKDDSRTDTNAPASAADIRLKMEAADRDGQNYLRRAAKILTAYYKSGAGTPEFRVAYEAGPLAKSTGTVTSGNESRSIFRMP